MNRLRKNQHIYSQFEINSICFFATMFWLMPLVLVITYVFDLDRFLDMNRFIFWVIIGVFALTFLGILTLTVQKDRLKRQVKPTYVGEYTYLLFIHAFGILGFVVFYDYLGLDRQYIANVLLILAAMFMYLLLRLGRAFFKIDYMQKK